MADESLMERLATGVFDPPVAYRDLADYHLEFQQLADVAPEADLRDRAEREHGCCAVVGPGGSGKSSLIAAVAASLSTTRFPVRVQGRSGEDVLTREGFASHIGSETLRALSAIEVQRPRSRRMRPARQKLANSTTTRAGGGRVDVGLPLPVEFRAQVGSSANEVMSERDAASVSQAIEQLVSVTAGFGRRMLLVVEDTDVFMPPDPLTVADEEHAHRFIEHVVSYLARDFPTSSLVAVNARYSDLIPPSIVASVAVPSLQSNAIGRLIEHYAHLSGLYISAEQVAEPEALAYAAGRYAETRDIRKTLALLHRATRKMLGEQRGERITAEILHGL